MLLTLTSTSAPARDVGYLLRKHPDRAQSFELGFGAVHVFYPEATDERCTAALLLDVDPVALVRGRSTSIDGAGLVEAYVNDRPYVASSFLSVAIARVLSAALGGRSDRPELVDRAIVLEAVVTPVRVLQEELPRRLFGPLGYEVVVDRVDVPAAAWVGLHRTIALRATTTVRRLLSQSLRPDPRARRREKEEYGVGDEERSSGCFVTASASGSWRSRSGARELIAKRYLRRAPSLARVAVARLNAPRRR